MSSLSFSCLRSILISSMVMKFASEPSGVVVGDGYMGRLQCSASRDGERGELGSSTHSVKCRVEILGLAVGISFS